MEKRFIGSLAVSVVGLGCNNFGSRLDADATAKVVHAAIDAGVNFFDTADIYGKTLSEEYLGKALTQRRKEVVLATKFGMPVDETRKGARPEYVRQACEDSLRRMGVAQIDLYQLHRPDPDTPIVDTLGALTELVRAGKVREIGCSNFTTEQLKEAEAAFKPGAVRFVSVQNEYSMLKRDAGLSVLPECQRSGTAFLPYFPLANGMLTGKYRKGQPTPEGRLKEAQLKNNERFAKIVNDHNFAIVEALIAFAIRHGHTMLELAFSWLLQHAPVASVIAGATSAEQIQANAKAASWKFKLAELAEIDKILSLPA